MGKGVVISPGAEIVGAKNIYLDDFVCLGKKAQFYAPEGYIKIGKRCHISAWILGQGGVEIGNYVAASGAIISASDSHQGGFRMAGPMLPPDQRNVRKAKVVIEDDAFIGLYSIVLPGVTVGQGAIVGPHSLVVRNVKPWTVVMGSPATVIGEREPVTLPPPD
jgi:acetyltransferase-like isoleucine patch superfamily enzyme